MRQIFTVDTVAVVVRHWFEVDLGDASMEHGARIEICGVEPRPHEGTESAGQRLTLGLPFWRADLFDRLAGEPGSFDVAHFHPHFVGPEPSGRAWDDELTARPWAWLTAALSDLRSTCARADTTPSEHDVGGARDMAAAIVAAAQRVAPVRCGSTATCHAWTRDASASVRLMIANLEDPSRLDPQHVAPWCTDEAA